MKYSEFASKHAHQLKKQIFFALVVETNRDSCFRCGLKIETPKELSIDHKVPWLDGEDDLFWNLQNIAFSHLGCNIKARRPRKHTYKPAHNRLKVGAGDSWCYKCKTIKKLSEFNKQSNRWNGVRHECRECQNRPRRKRVIANAKSKKR